MNYLFYILPLMGALIGLTLAGLLLFVLKNLPLTSIINENLQENELAPLLDQQLDKLVLTFQQQIPMAAMFLKGAMLEKLKTQAEGQLMQLFPGIKEKIIHKVEDPQFRSKIISKFVTKLLLVSAAIGFFIGLVFSLIFLNIMS